MERFGPDVACRAGAPGPANNDLFVFADTLI